MPLLTVSKFTPEFPYFLKIIFLLGLIRFDFDISFGNIELWSYIYFTLHNLSFLTSSFTHSSIIVVHFSHDTCPSDCDADICMIPHMPCDAFGYLISRIHMDDEWLLRVVMTCCLSALTDMFLLPLRGKFNVCQRHDTDVRLSSPACTYWHMLSHCHFPIWNCSIVKKPDGLASVANESCIWLAYEMSAWIYPLSLFSFGFRFWFFSYSYKKDCHQGQLFLSSKGRCWVGSRPRRPTWKSTV